MQQQRLTRQDKLYILAKACTEKSVNPDKGNYAGLIRGVCAGRLFVSAKAAQELTCDLTAAYRFDKWQAILGTENETEQTQETITYTPRTFSPNPPTLNPLKTLKLTMPLEPIKKVQPKTSTREDAEADAYLNKYAATANTRLTEQQTALVLHSQAEKDRFNGIGRITLHDAWQIVGNKNLTTEDLKELWQKHYPGIEAETRGNALLIFWDGKETMRSVRDLNRTVQPKTPVFNAQNSMEGDIAEDDGESETVQDTEEAIS